MDNIHIHEVESRVLAHILQAGSRAMITASRYLDEPDFSNLQHRIIFSCIGGAYSGAGAFNDAFTLVDWIKKNKSWLDAHFKRLSFKGDTNEARAAVIDRIVELSTVDIEPSFNLKNSCQLIYENSLREKLITKHAELINSLKDGTDIFQAVDETYQFAVDSYSKFENIQPYHTLKAATDELIEQLEREKNGEVVRLPTGYDGLDRIIKGYENGRLYVLGAEEKIGKSIFVSQSAVSIARKDIPVGILSLEMKRTELARRYLSMIAGCDAVNRLDIPALKEHSERFSNLPILIHDLSLNTKQLAQKIQSLVIERNVGIVFVDYLQLVEASAKSYSKTDEINQTVRTLKRLAMDLNIPIVLIASLTIKGMYSRAERKPRASDFRDSGQIPYDADCILMLWKPDTSDESYRELFVERSRYSRTGEPIPLLFDTERLLFVPTEKRELSAIPTNGTEDYF